MRRILYSILTGDEQLYPIFGDRWVTASGQHGTDLNGDPAKGLPRPFGVFRLTGSYPGMGHITQRGLEVWIHDEPGSFDLIDNALKRVRDVLTSVEQRRGSNGSIIQQISWTNDSPDLFDDVRRTNTKMASFNLVGSGV